MTQQLKMCKFSGCIPYSSGLQKTALSNSCLKVALISLSTSDQAALDEKKRKKTVQNIYITIIYF